MAIQHRAESGRATSRYADRELFDVVAAVARHVSAGDPQSVTQAAWDAARTAAGYPDAPTARAICMRLEDHGQPIAWSSLKTRALSDGDAITIAERFRFRSVYADRNATERHVYFALNLIARELGTQTFSPARYTMTRDRLVARDRRRHDGGGGLVELMPTQPAVIRVCGDWDAALEAAGLVPRPRSETDPSRARSGQPGRTQRRYAPSMPLVEAISRFVDWNGEWPSHTRLSEFSKGAGIRVAARQRMSDGSTERWGDIIERAREYRTELGLDSPAGPPKRGGRGKNKPVKFPPNGIAGAPERGNQLAYEEEECIDALWQFIQAMPRGQATQERYKLYAVEHGLPSTQVFERFGGFGRLRRKAEKRRRGA